MTTAEFQTSQRATSPRIKRSQARAAVAASKRTKDTLPRYVYELAEVPVPANATDILQKHSRR